MNNNLETQFTESLKLIWIDYNGGSAIFGKYNGKIFDIPLSTEKLEELNPFIGKNVNVKLTFTLTEDDE